MKVWAIFVSCLLFAGIKRLTCSHEWQSQIKGELGFTYLLQTCRRCKAVRAKTNGL